MARFVRCWPLAAALVCAAARAAGDHELTVVIRGSEPGVNFARVLVTLDAAGALDFKTHRADPGETVASIYRKRWDLAHWFPEIEPLAAQWSGQSDLNRRLAGGETILYPDLDTQSYAVKKTFTMATQSSRAELSRAKEQWGERAKVVDEKPGSVDLDLPHLKLVVEVNTAEQLARAIEALAELRSPDVAVLNRPPKPPPPALRFSIRLEGGDIAADANQVLGALVDLKLAPLAEDRIRPGETVEALYKRRLNIPVNLVPLAEKINRRSYSKLYRAGEPVRIPDVQFKRYEWTWRLDTRRPAEAQRRKDILAHWDAKSGRSRLELVKESRDVAQGVYDLVLYGYDLAVDAPTPEDLASAKAELSKIQSYNIVLLFPLDKAAPLHSQTFVDAKTYTGQMREGPNEVAPGMEVSLGCYLERCQPRAVLTAACAPTMCGKVLLLDQLPDLQHPDVSAALLQDGRPGPDLPPPAGQDPNKRRITLKPFEEGDHGTHLAGIVAARPNGFGAAGVNPHAIVEALDWPALQRDIPALLTRLRNAAAPRNLPVVLFASSWPLQLREGETRPQREEDFERDPLIRYIVQRKPLWIAAAGQCRKNRDGTLIDCPDGAEVHLDPMRSPVNVGQKANVVVVTSCDNCYSPTARLTQGANRSETHVHVAAPGSGVFSTLPGSRFGFAGGTSQAAAMAAGVASAMVELHDYYNGADVLKRRLQVTSYPLPGLPLATGAIDLRAALLDPRKHYRIPESGEAAGEDAPYQEFRPKAWCAETLKLVVDGAPRGISVGEVMRLHRRGDSWIVYHANNDEAFEAKISRLGPGSLSGEPCLVLEDGGRFPIQSARDILFADKPRLEGGS